MHRAVFVLITAAGESSRMGGAKKELLSVNDKPIIISAITPFFSVPQVKEIFITYNEKSKTQFKTVLEEAGLYSFDNEKENNNFPPIHLVLGGKTRQQSIFNGLKAIKKRTEAFSDDEASNAFVLIHDGARPFISTEIIEAVIDGTIAYGACAPVIPITDSLKTVNSTSFIERHPARTSYQAIQTPQGFNLNAIFDAHTAAASDTVSTFTDDTEIYASFAVDNKKIFTVPGSEKNIKITYMSDLKASEKNISDAPAPQEEIFSKLRIGHGYDIHRLELHQAQGNEKPLIIGGIIIPFEKGLSAHSDGDVLYHALIDALLGAAALGDIGSHFPPSDKAYKNIDSAILVQKTTALIKEAGFKPINIDITVVLEKPRLREHIDAIRKNIADNLCISLSCVSVKAKTKEACDATGQNLAIEAFASVLLARQI